MAKRVASDDLDFAVSTGLVRVRRQGNGHDFVIPTMPLAAPFVVVGTVNHFDGFSYYSVKGTPVYACISSARTGFGRTPQEALGALFAHEPSKSERARAKKAAVRHATIYRDTFAFWLRPEYIAEATATVERCRAEDKRTGDKEAAKVTRRLAACVSDKYLAKQRAFLAAAQSTLDAVLALA